MSSGSSQHRHADDGVTNWWSWIKLPPNMTEMHHGNCRILGLRLTLKMKKDKRKASSCLMTQNNMELWLLWRLYDGCSTSETRWLVHCHTIRSSQHHINTINRWSVEKLLSLKCVANFVTVFLLWLKHRTRQRVCNWDRKRFDSSAAVGATLAMVL